LLYQLSYEILYSPQLLKNPLFRPISGIEATKVDEYETLPKMGFENSFPRNQSGFLHNDSPT
jgi:hypothetical protein